MADQKCPKCGEGKLHVETIDRYLTRIGGTQVEIPNATIARCNHCDEFVVAATEVKRWEAIARQQLLSSEVLLNPGQVKALRERLGLAVADFAALLGVTRQTVHAWERADVGMQLGPAALFLKVIEKELAGTVSGVLEVLVSLAKARGLDVSLKTSHRQEPSFGRVSPIRLMPDGMPGFHNPVC